jgi:hypothetical protein
VALTVLFELAPTTALAVELVSNMSASAMKVTLALIAL